MENKNHGEKKEQGAGKLDYLGVNWVILRQ